MLENALLGSALHTEECSKIEHPALKTSCPVPHYRPPSQVYFTTHLIAIGDRNLYVGEVLGNDRIFTTVHLPSNWYIYVLYIDKRFYIAAQRNTTRYILTTMKSKEEDNFSDELVDYIVDNILPLM